jgi:acetoacetyl-CoA reductase
MTGACCREVSLRIPLRLIPHVGYGVRRRAAAYPRRPVLFLVADDAGFITGSTLSANGGQYME